MLIKTVECDQFAGVTGKKYEFKDGLNLIVGPNESGKSTLVDLIFHLLFKGIKVDGRKDADFVDRYFPKKSEGVQGNVIDGTLTFETEEGKYVLKKEWEGKEGIVKLILPDETTIKGDSTVREVLDGILQYGEGLYGEIVFPSKKREQLAVESIMREFSKKKEDKLSVTRADISSTLNKAVIETGGVSIDKMEARLKEIILSYNERWDEEADMPEGGVKRGINNKWAASTTKDAKDGNRAIILNSYYKMEEIRKNIDDAIEAEKQIENIKRDIKIIKANKEKANKNRQEFQKFRGMLGQLSALKDIVIEKEKTLQELNEALKKWPECNDNLMLAKKLKEEKEQAELCLKYEKLAELKKSCSEAGKTLSRLDDVEAATIQRVRALLREQVNLEGKLAGLNLSLNIEKLCDTDIQVNSVKTGDNIYTDNSSIAVTEAVEIIIPDIARMEITPKEVNTGEVKNRIAEIENELHTIFAKYDVKDIEGLENKHNEYEKQVLCVDNLKREFESELNGHVWEEIEAGYNALSEKKHDKEKIELKIDKLCGNIAIDAYIGRMESFIEQYTSRYESLEKLEENISSANDHISLNKQKMKLITDIPDEYKNIQDAESYNSSLEEKVSEYEEKLAVLGEMLRAAENNMKDRSAEEYLEELQKATEVFESKKAAYKHWKNIYRLFVKLKDENKGNPTEDIENRFREYLSMVSEGEVSLASFDDEMNASITSGKHALTYDILSSGTKDTISLAFRLAMLEHIFPDGGGLAVFDDPFTDMDPKRVSAACGLIKEFAKKNQVIFITCDDKYERIFSA